MTTWPPTSLFNRRAYGSENLRPSPQKEFCNTIWGRADKRPIDRRSRLLTDFVAEVGDDDGGGEDKAVDAEVGHLLHRKRIIACDAPGLHGTYAKALLCSRRRSHQKFGEPPEVLSDSSQRELELGALWPP